MTRRRCGWLLSILALVAAPALTTLVAGQGSLATRKAEAALQAAMNKETVAGDLTGAIKDYNAIVTQYGRSDQTIAARALMRAAGAYEKLGRTAESRQVYAQIAKDYANIAPDAGDRGHRHCGARSANSAHAGLATGARDQAAARDDDAERIAECAERRRHARGRVLLGFSPRQSVHPQPGLRSDNDARRRGWLTCLLPGREADRLHPGRGFGAIPRVSSLYIVNATPGAQPRTLVSNEAGLVNVSPFGWSLDGKTVYANVGGMAARTGVQASLVGVSVADGKVTTIKAFEPKQGAIQPRLSPDGRFIAYSLLSGTAPNRRIFTIDVNGQNERDVVKLAGMNMNPTWSPDGTQLLFWNNLTGNLAVNSTLWSVAVDDGAAAGSPSTVHSGLVGLETLLGMSPLGTLYTFRAIPNTPNVFIADRTAGSSIVAMFPGEAASWSFDGKAIAFLREAGAAGYQLIVRSVDSGEERSYPHDNVSNMSPRWLHDSSGFLVGVGGSAHQSTDGAVYFVDATTGRYRLLFPRNANGRARGGSAAILDGRPDRLHGCQEGPAGAERLHRNCGFEPRDRSRNASSHVPGRGLARRHGIEPGAQPGWGDPRRDGAPECLGCRRSGKPASSRLASTVRGFVRCAVPSPSTARQTS